MSQPSIKEIDQIHDELDKVKWLRIFRDEKPVLYQAVIDFYLRKIVKVTPVGSEVPDYQKEWLERSEMLHELMQRHLKHERRSLDEVDVMLRNYVPSKRCHFCGRKLKKNKSEDSSS